MDITPQSTQTGLASAVTSTYTSTITTGRQDFLSILLRLIGAEMYKIRRRALPKILLIVGICIIILAFLVVAINVITDLNTSIQEYSALVPCSQVPPVDRTTSSPSYTCINHSPTHQELAAAQKMKQQIVTFDSTPLRLPDSLFSAVSVIMIVGTTLLIILTGTIVGGEYTGGTIRLMNTRGPTRIQFLLAKIGAILICLVVGFVIILLIGVVMGALLNLLTGISTPLNFLQKGGWSHVLLYLFAAMFGLFVYAMLALFLATLGRATVAGVTGAIVWLVVENSFSSISNLVTAGPVAKILKTISSYLISSNVNALCNNAYTLIEKRSTYFLEDPSAALTSQHALLVLSGYLVVFIGVAILVSVRRDIIN